LPKNKLFWARIAKVGLKHKIGPWVYFSSNDEKLNQAAEKEGIIVL
jgi:hypothetical protein